MAGRDEEKGGGKLPADARAMIGAHLRRMYDNVVSEPIPDRFTLLLDQLEEGKAPGAEKPNPANEPDHSAARATR